jgi:cytochrome c553
MKRTLLVLAAAAASAVHAQPAGDAKAAEPYISMCTGCHSIPGYQASFPRVYKVPKIGGQSAAYIESALRAYAKGERSHPTMDGIAKTLTDKQIADIAAYYAERGATSSR